MTSSSTTVLPSFFRVSATFLPLQFDAGRRCDADEGTAEDEAEQDTSLEEDAEEDADEEGRRKRRCMRRVAIETRLNLPLHPRDHLVFVLPGRV